jgi:drug/metabolite transporter (DMT)-like permease
MAGLAPLILATQPAALIPTDGTVWIHLLGLGLVTALLPQLLYVLAAPHVGPARTAAAGAVELPVMIGLGWLAFGEALGPREVVAAGLVLAAVALAPAIDTRRPAPR